MSYTGIPGLMSGPKRHPLAWQRSAMLDGLRLWETVRRFARWWLTCPNPGRGAESRWSRYTFDCLGAARSLISARQFRQVARIWTRPSYPGYWTRSAWRSRRDCRHCHDFWRCDLRGGPEGMPTGQFDNNPFIPADNVSRATYCASSTRTATCRYQSNIQTKIAVCVGLGRGQGDLARRRRRSAAWLRTQSRGAVPLAGNTAAAASDQISPSAVGARKFQEMKREAAAQPSKDPHPAGPQSRRTPRRGLHRRFNRYAPPICLTIAPGTGASPKCAPHHAGLDRSLVHSGPAFSVSADKADVSAWPGRSRTRRSAACRRGRGIRRPPTRSRQHPA